MADRPYPKIDVTELPEVQGLQIELWFAQLAALYDAVDGYIELTTYDLDLPCHRGCSACCRNSVFLTPLEFYYVWSYVEECIPEPTRSQIIDAGLELYRQHKDRIEAFEQAPPEGQEDHYSIAKDLHFDCPLLDPEGACRVYPVREMFSRLFGCSFQEAGGIYGCHLVQEHLEGQEVTLLPTRTTAKQLDAFPLTDKRQVYPYYIHALFGD